MTSLPLIALAVLALLALAAGMALWLAAVWPEEGCEDGFDGWLACKDCMYWKDGACHLPANYPPRCD